MSETSNILPRPRMRSRARSFFLAARFLPPDLRRDVHLVYAFCRTVDDLVDDPPAGLERREIIDRLEGWEQDLMGRACADAMVRDMQRIIRAYAVPPGYFVMLLQGARMDLTLRHLDTLEDLRSYATLVAGSVGMILAQMMGARHEVALAAARDLGVAMQITNILRDVAEDLDRDRVYLPRETLNAAGCTLHLLHQRQPSAPFRAVMREIAGEARLRYAKGLAGVRFLEPEVQLSVTIAAGLYAGILGKIERSGYDVFPRRTHLGMIEKWSIVIPLCLRHWPGPESRVIQSGTSEAGPR